MEIEKNRTLQKCIYIYIYKYFTIFQLIIFVIKSFIHLIHGNMLMYVLMKKLKIKKNNPSVSLDNNGQQLKTGGGQTVGQTMSLCLLLLSSNQIQQHTTQVHNFKCFKRTNILVETTGCTVCTAEYET